MPLEPIYPCLSLFTQVPRSMKFSEVRVAQVHYPLEASVEDMPPGQCTPQPRRCKLGAIRPLGWSNGAMLCTRRSPSQTGPFRARAPVLWGGDVPKVLERGRKPHSPNIGEGVI